MTTDTENRVRSVGSFMASCAPSSVRLNRLVGAASILPLMWIRSKNGSPITRLALIKANAPQIPTQSMTMPINRDPRIIIGEAETRHSDIPLTS